MHHVAAKHSRPVASPRGAAAGRAQRAWEEGRRLRSLGRLEAACQQFEQATRHAPQDQLYWLNLARCEQQLDRLDAAHQHARRAFDMDRSSTLACNLLSEVLRSQRRYRDLLTALNELTPQAHRDAHWHQIKAAAHMELREYEDALQASASALAEAGSDAGLRRSALMSLGHCLSLLKRHEEASWCHRMLLDADPLALGSALYAAHFAAWACDWPMLAQDMVRLQTCIERVRACHDLDQVETMNPFCLLSLSDDPQLLQWVAQLAARKGSPVVAPRPPHRPVPRPGGKLRIGLMSSDFHMHATGILIAEMLEHIDRDRFELIFYSGGPDDGSPMRRRIQATAARWHEMLGWTNPMLAQRIRDDEIGVLLEMKGYTLGSRLSVMAERPAPLQVAWLGYPGSCGAEFVDYLIGDPVVTPLDDQPDFTERIAQMPHCYQPNDSTRSQPAAMSRAQCGLPAQGMVFASFNQSYKIVPEVFAVWCRILQATPQSVLWLLVPQEDVQMRLRHAAASHGISPERLVFAPFVGVETHRSRLPNVDLFLDNFPCSGHTTASDALWAGVPVLTLQGRNFASRVAASLLHTLALPELVTTSLADYERTAIDLAHDRFRLTALRQRLAEARQRSPLFDGRRYARDFEQLLTRMVERHDAGLPPAALPAQPFANEPAC